MATLPQQQRTKAPERKLPLSRNQRRFGPEEKLARIPPASQDVQLVFTQSALPHTVWQSWSGFHMVSLAFECAHKCDFGKLRHLFREMAHICTGLMIFPSGTSFVSNQPNRPANLQSPVFELLEKMTQHCPKEPNILKARGPMGVVSMGARQSPATWTLKLPFNMGHHPNFGAIIHYSSGSLRVQLPRPLPRPQP